MWRNWYMGAHSGPPFEGNQYAIGQSESTCHYALAPPSGFNVYFEIGVHLHLCRHYCDHNQRNPTSSYFIRARHNWYFAATKHTEYDPHAADYQNSYKYHCHVPILNHQLIAVITTLMATKSAKVWLISKSARQGLRLAASSRFLSSQKICLIFCIFIIQMFNPSF